MTIYEDLAAGWAAAPVLRPRAYDEDGGYYTDTGERAPYEAVMGEIAAQTHVHNIVSDLAAADFHALFAPAMPEAEARSTFNQAMIAALRSGLTFTIGDVEYWTAVSDEYKRIVDAGGPLAGADFLSFVATGE